MGVRVISTGVFVKRSGANTKRRNLCASSTSRIILLFTLLLTGCGSPKPWYHKDYDRTLLESASPTLPDSPGNFTLYLIGDCGKSTADGSWPVFVELQKHLQGAGPNSAVIYLGDNIYEYGLPAEDAQDRKEMERRMTSQLDPTKGYNGKVIVLPGNHDWAMGTSDGFAARVREEEFVEGYLQRGNTYLPDGGCPGPFELALGPDIVLLAYDSQWWLHKHHKPGKAEGCESGTDAEFIAAFKAALERNKGKQIIVAAHHPFYSYGAHGGHYHPKFHLFPLLMANHALWIPLPVLGSLAVWYRQLAGSIQDIPHPRYRALKRELEGLFAQYPGMIYVTGHDHNLQYLPVEGRHYIVSGSGSKSTYVGHGKKALFTDAELGFGRVIFAPDGKRWLEFYVPGDDGKSILRFATELK
jgi:hypothetical protein